MAKKVNDARQLIESLKGEKKSLTEDSNLLIQEKRQLLGAAAFIAYAEAFNQTFVTNNLFEKVFKGIVLEDFLAYEPQKMNGSSVNYLVVFQVFKMLY